MTCEIGTRHFPYFLGFLASFIIFEIAIDIIFYMDNKYCTLKMQAKIAVGFNAALAAGNILIPVSIHHHVYKYILFSGDYPPTVIHLQAGK